MSLKYAVAENKFVENRYHDIWQNRGGMQSAGYISVFWQLWHQGKIVTRPVVSLCPRIHQCFLDIIHQNPGRL